MYREEDMIPVIEKYFQLLGYQTFTEVSVSIAGHGIADVVAVKLNPSKIAQRIENGQFSTIKTQRYFELLYIISEDFKGTDLKEIIGAYSYSREYLIKLLRKLEEDRYIVELEKNRYRKINNIIPLASEVVAIEAKLENWQAGIKQARRYQLFANRVYLALQDSYCHRPDLHRFEKNNIGLLSVALGEEKVLELVESNYQKPLERMSNIMFHEAIWQRIRGKYSDFYEKEVNIVGQPCF